MSIKIELIDAVSTYQREKLLRQGVSLDKAKYLIITNQNKTFELDNSKAEVNSIWTTERKQPEFVRPTLQLLKDVFPKAVWYKNIKWPMNFIVLGVVYEE